MSTEELVKRSVEAFNRLSPEEQKAHREAQRESWVVGELMLEDPELTREEAVARYRRAREAIS